MKIFGVIQEPVYALKKFFRLINDTVHPLMALGKKLMSIEYDSIIRPIQNEKKEQITKVRYNLQKKYPSEVVLQYVGVR